MAVTLERLLAKVEQIALEQPGYAIGGTGKGGVCDCVGLVMGAMYRVGRGAYPMHCSNYFARYQMETLEPIYNAGALFLGEIVYKAREPTDGGYDLHERYLPGGRYWTGVDLDYYHIGIVTAVSPLIITHCTRDTAAGIDGITTDSKLGKWSYGGRLKGVTYTNEGGTKIMAALYDAKIVTTGGTLNIRAAASKSGTVLGKAPNGSLLQVLEETSDAWARVYWEGIEGYVMRTFLSRITGEDSDDSTESDGDDGDGIAVTLTATEAAAIRSIYAKL